MPETEFQVEEESGDSLSVRMKHIGDFLPLHANSSSSNWREGLIYVFLLSGVVLGAAILIISIFYAIRIQSYTVVFVYGLVYAGILIVTFVRGISLRIRIYALLALTYILALASLYGGGPFISGRLWLVVFAILASLLLGIRAGLISVLINAITVIVITQLFLSGNSDWGLTGDKLDLWWISSVTFILICVVVSITLSALIASLERSLGREQAMTAQLRRQIEERERADSALRESEYKFRKIVDNANEAIVVAQDGEFKFTNPVVSKIIGHPSAEISGMKLLEVIHPEDRELVAERHARRQRGENLPASYSFRIVQQDGRVRWMDINSVLIDWEERPATLSFLIDTTKRKLAEAALQESYDQMERRVQERTQELSTLFEAARAVSSNLDIEEVVWLIAQQMVDSLNVSGCTIFAYDRTEDAVTTWIDWQTDDLDRSRPLGTVYPLSNNEMIRNVLENHQPLIVQVSAHQSDSEKSAYFGKERTQSLLMLPLIAGEEVLGLVELDNEVVDREFTSDEIELCQMLADQAGIAIRNARGYEQAQSEIIERRRAEEALTSKTRLQNKLLEISRQLTSSLDLNEVLTQIACAATEMMEGYSTAIYILDEDDRTLVPVATIDPDFEEETISTTLDIDNSFTGQAVKARRSLYFNHAETDDTGYQIPGTPALENEHIIAAPFLSDGDIIGAVCVARLGVQFQDEDLAAVDSVAIYATTALRNAQAHQALQTEAAERKRAEAALILERASLAERVEQRTQELRAANAELARAARLKDEFLASMSHELRTPLNAILGMSEVLLSNIYGPVNEKQHKSLQIVSDSGSHLLALINDILDVSRIEAGRLELMLESVEVDALCHSSLQFITHDASRRNQGISVNIDPSVSLITADARRLKQILVNLLNNAVKFTPDGGKIGLDVVGDNDNNTIQFTVWDNGIGIPDEKIETLFRPFVQLDSGLSRHYEGTGLGLTLVYRMTELHGGSVSVESKPGHGSRFTVSIPLQTGVRTIPETETECLSNDSSVSLTGLTRGPLVLLAEDNASNAEMITDYLHAQGYSFLLAHDGNEAVKLTRNHRPDIILMDIQMPGMDGLEATRRIRSNAELGQIPIIAISALAMPGDRARCLQAGADDYIPKPISLKMLLDIITRLVPTDSQTGN